MRNIVILAVALSAITVWLLRPDEKPTAEAIVTAPRAEVYASLDELFSEIERKAQTRQTYTGDPPHPVTFSFDRSEGDMLGFSGKAGLRKVGIKVWLEDGERPGETIAKIRFSPESMLEKSGYPSDPYRALKITLQSTSNQFVDGERITVLFGRGRSPSREADAWESEAHETDWVS